MNANDGNVVRSMRQKRNRFERPDRYGRQNGYDRYDLNDRSDRYDQRDRYNQRDRYDQHDRYDQRDRYEHQDRYDHRNRPDCSGYRDRRDHRDSAEGEDLWSSFMKELISYSQVGVLLYLQGKPSNPAKIAKACQVSESKATYMREYLPDEKGQIRGINFERVRMP